MRSAGGSSTPLRDEASPSGRSASPGSGPAGSGSSCGRAASAPSWPTGAPPTSSARPTSSPTGSTPDLLHLPAYSLIGVPLGDAGRRAIELARERGRPRQPRSRLRRRRSSPTAAGPRAPRRRGCAGHPVLDPGRGRGVPRRLRRRRRCWSRRRSRSSSAAPGARRCSRRGLAGPHRFEVATPSLTATDTTGAGDAFDAGLHRVYAQLAGRTPAARPAALRRAALAGPPSGSPATRDRVAGAHAGMIADRLDVGPEVAAALAGGRPVVALESTLISHGLPYPQNLEVARASEAAVRDGRSRACDGGDPRRPGPRRAGRGGTRGACDGAGGLRPEGGPARRSRRRSMPAAGRRRPSRPR